MPFTARDKAIEKSMRSAKAINQLSYGPSRLLTRCDKAINFQSTLFTPAIETFYEMQQDHQLLRMLPSRLFTRCDKAVDEAIDPGKIKMNMNCDEVGARMTQLLQRCSTQQPRRVTTTFWPLDQYLNYFFLEDIETLVSTCLEVP